MSEDVKEAVEALLRLPRAPTQLKVLFYLLESGRSMTIKEMAERLGMTRKAVERAVDKLHKKGLVERSRYMEGHYRCSIRKMVTYLIAACTELRRSLEELSEKG